MSPLPWNTFVSSMDKFSVKSQKDWCQVCGNSTGVCSSEALDDSGDGGSVSGAGNESQNQSCHRGGISKAVAGVIGAMVTLAVILAVELAILIVGGLRLVSKKRLNRNGGNGAANGGVKA